MRARGRGNGRSDGIPYARRRTRQRTACPALSLISRVLVFVATSAEGADAGFHAVAPDMRGYGQMDRPEAMGQVIVCPEPSCASLRRTRTISEWMLPGLALDKARNGRHRRYA
jgi:hypothetical protein